MPLQSFQVCELIETEYGTARIAVLALDTEQNGFSYDLIVKDLESGQLLPVLILNTDGEVAFDKLAGFYYTQVDPTGRGARVFRHQLGTDHRAADILIYDESQNPDFSVSVAQSASKELILMNVKSTFKPRCNETWVRRADYDFEEGNLGKRNKFWLVSPMQAGVTYDVKHSGEFLYKLTNEGTQDASHFKLDKIRMPDVLKQDSYKKAQEF